MADFSAQDAARLRPQISPQTQVLAQRYAQAVQRMIRLRAMHGDTELRCQVPPEVVAMVAEKLHVARFKTIKLVYTYSSNPNGRLIIQWPDIPMQIGAKGLPPAPAITEAGDYPEWMYRVHRFLARWGLVASNGFQVVRLSNAYDRASEATSRD